MLPSLGLPDTSTTSSPPDVTTPPHHPFGGGRRTVEGWSDIEIEYWFARWFGLAAVVVDYVADFAGTGRGGAGNVPIVAVEGGFGPKGETEG